MTSGTPDLMLFVFAPNRTSGSRSDYDGYSNAAGAGGTETLTYTAGASGDLGILVLNANGIAGNYNLRIRDITPLAAPASCAASDGTATDRVTVTWPVVSGATYYRLYRNTANNSASAIAVTGWIASTSYADLTAAVGPANYYWVKAAADSAGYRVSAFSPVDSGYVQPPTLVDDAKVTISSDPSYYQFAEAAAYLSLIHISEPTRPY